MGKSYRPSNGTEGIDFMERFCFQCRKEKRCKIIGESMCHEVESPKYPKQWIYDGNGHPTCTNFYSGPYKAKPKRAGALLVKMMDSELQ